eukprot:6080895-Prorocentrum_lima.AAC.1
MQTNGVDGVVNSRSIQDTSFIKEGTTVLKQCDMIFQLFLHIGLGCSLRLRDQKRSSSCNFN